MNGEAQYDGGEALSMLEVCDHEFEFRSVSAVVYFSPNKFNCEVQKKKRWRFAFYQEYGKKQVSQSGETKEKQDRSMQSSYYDD